MSREKFQAITGKQEFTDPEGMALAGGTVCGFDNGQIMLWTGADAQAAFDGFLAAFGQQDLPRTPVERVGEGAFAPFFDPEDMGFKGDC